VLADSGAAVVYIAFCYSVLIITMRIAHNFDRNYEHTITKSSNSLLYFSSRMCPDMFICICVILLNVDALAPPPLKVLLYVFRILLNMSSHCLIVDALLKVGHSVLTLF
jgi:hypothetical protein